MYQFMDMLQGFGGDFATTATLMTNEKYSEIRKSTSMRLCKMKSGKFRILYGNGTKHSEYFDVDMAKKNFVELYEKGLR